METTCSCRLLKGCRTAIIIGGFTSLIATPVALLFGMLAGYFGKRVDDAVQYTYSVISSIPDILLLIALLLVFGKDWINSATRSGSPRG